MLRHFPALDDYNRAALFTLTFTIIIIHIRNNNQNETNYTDRYNCYDYYNWN